MYNIVLKDIGSSGIVLTLVLIFTLKFLIIIEAEWTKYKAKKRK